MKLSISNIAWKSQDDEKVYELMRKYGFSGLEVAPTRFFPENPYDKLAETRKLFEDIKGKDGFVIPSMQSIWYGRSERLFGTEEERRILFEYTKKAIDWAEAAGCANLVFGCPRNRQLKENEDETVALDFFRALGEYAIGHRTVIGMEANPVIYNTNYVNTTAEALSLIEKVNSRGFRLNLDIGTMIQNDEDIDEVAGNVQLISHVHISEPGLKPVEYREIHGRMSNLLKAERYTGFVSVEMGVGEDISAIEKVMEYIAETFGS